MCGIAGFILQREVPDLALVRAMCDQIRHRGPDDEGFCLDGGCALGMRRLSIIDLETGHQPISNEQGTVWVVFNGEIYNYRELREELLRRGHRFSTASDTEVLVHLYEEDGEQGISKLRGMFAFAIWDRRLNRLVLARDRFGKKPLYYAALPQGLYFGSEIKCLRAAGVPTSLDAAALGHYLQLGFIPHPRSIYEAVRKVAPGGWLAYERNGDLRQGRYWRVPSPVDAEPEGAPAGELITQIGRKFDESVRIRMIADVPLGAFLSGGIDSGSVVASMALQSPEPVKTFSIGFEEPGFNELEHAALVAKQYSTDHHAIVVRPDVVELVPRLVRQFDEPFGDCSCIPTFIVSEFAANHVKVALSGDGGDELFAGYDHFFQVERRRVWDRVPRALRRVLSMIATALPYSARGKNFMRMASRGTALERFIETTYAPRFLLERLVRPRWLPPAGPSYLATEFADCLLPEPVSPLGQAIYFAATCGLTEDMLVKVDRMSMANSLEVRCPLLDHELAELAARVPPRCNMRGNRGKQVLLDAVGDRLPPALLQLKKTGFGVPLAAWFRGPLKDLLQDHLLAPRFLQKGIVSPSFVRYLIDEHLRARRDNYYWLWRLLVLDLWLRENAEIL